MTLEEIARALGLNEKTIDRDFKSIADSFRAGGIDLATLGLANIKFVAAVIVAELQKKCPHDSDRGSGDERDPHVSNDAAPASKERVPIPRRWSKP